MNKDEGPKLSDDPTPEELRAWVEYWTRCPACKSKLSMADAALGYCFWCGESLE